LEDLNLKLEEEAAERQEAQEAQEALQDLNAKLEEEAAERQEAQEALQDLNAKLEEEGAERQAAQEDLQDLNLKLEDEAAKRQAAQEDLQDLNAKLEDEAAKRQAAQEDLQDLNAKLEEEAAKRQAAQESLLASMDELLIRDQQIRQYSKQVEATNSELQSLVNIIAHDFRSPMVNLQGFAQEIGVSLAELRKVINDETLCLMEKTHAKIDELLDKDVPEAQAFINSAIDRLSRMIEALLKLAREGRRQMIYKEVDMSKLVNAVLQSYYHQTEDKTFQFEVGALPIIKTDQLAVEQIMSNLVDNAIKYLNFGQPGKIGVTGLDNGNDYLFSVQDNGRGIAAGDLERIFEIFWRSGRQDLPGEGMGLACVRTLIRQLGGKVWCESELGVGTKMMFTVPKHYLLAETSPGASELETVENI